MFFALEVSDILGLELHQPQVSIPKATRLVGFAASHTGLGRFKHSCLGQVWVPTKPKYAVAPLKDPALHVQYQLFWGRVPLLNSAKLHELGGGGLFQIKKCFTRLADWFEHFLKATRFPPVETLEATDLMDDIGFLPT